MAGKSQTPKTPPQTGAYSKILTLASSIGATICSPSSLPAYQAAARVNGATVFKPVFSV